MKRVEQHWRKLAEYGPEAAVIDPRDRRGFKNRYVGGLRDRVVLRALGDLPPQARVLDLGCGSGNLARTLDHHGYCAVGVDISAELLRYTRRHRFVRPSLFVQYDGRRLPLASDSLDAAVTYGVLIYVGEDAALEALLGEVFRALKPGAPLVAIEQTRRRAVFDKERIKLQRTPQGFMSVFERCGFVRIKVQIVRRGHFPLIYPIRYGLIPEAWFASIAAAEAALGQVFGHPWIDYADTAFVYRK